MIPSIWSNQCDGEAVRLHQQRVEDAMLADCIRNDSTGEINRQQEIILRQENEQRCLSRALRLMAFFTGLAFVGAGHSIVVLKDGSTGDMRDVLWAFGVVGLASLISFVTFASLWGIRRHQLREQRDRVRHHALELLSARGVDTTRFTHRAF